MLRPTPMLKPSFLLLRPTSSLCLLHRTSSFPSLLLLRPASTARRLTPKPAPKAAPSTRRPSTPAKPSSTSYPVKLRVKPVPEPPPPLRTQFLELLTYFTIFLVPRLSFSLFIGTSMSPNLPEKSYGLSLYRTRIRRGDYVIFFIPLQKVLEVRRVERAGDDENKRRRIEMEKFVRKQIGGGGEREGEKMRLPEMVRVGKRVVGLEGDLVSVGEMSEETGRLRKKKGETERVPEGHVWIEGDDEGSLDSRVVGPIPLENVREKVFWLFGHGNKALKGDEWIREGAIVERGGVESVKMTAGLWKDYQTYLAKKREAERLEWEKMNQKDEEERRLVREKWAKWLPWLRN